MSTKYEQCPPDVQALCGHVMEKHQPDLQSAGVLALCLFADAGFDKMQMAIPAVKSHGHPCAATISITPVKQRAAGMADALIVIDRHVWVDLPDKQRIALLDHELEHLAVSKDDEGRLVVDCCGRPALSLRRHDYVLMGFQSIIDRHGDEAIEVMEVVKFHATSCGQVLMQFMGDLKAAAKPKRAA